MPERAEDCPAVWGAALAEHLKANGYRSRHVVFGLGNRDLFARRRALPPTPNEQARRDLLRLAIEKEYGDGRLVFDYLDAAPINGSSHPAALLIGTSRLQVDRLETIAAAAKLRLTGVVSSALSAATDNQTGISGKVVVDACGADVVVQHGGKPSGLTRISFNGGDGFTNLVNQLASSADLNHAGSKLVVAPANITQQSVADELVRGLSDRFTVASREAEDIASQVAGSLFQSKQAVPNFSKSRLQATSTSRGMPYRRVVVGSLLALVLVAGLFAIWGFKRASDLHQLQQTYRDIEPEMRALEKLRDQTNQAAPWFQNRPRTIEALAAVTECFPRSGRIWVSSLQLDASGQGSIKCRADGKPTMLECLRAMQASATLQDVRLSDWNEADRSTGVVSFEIIFTYSQTSGGS